MKDIGPTQPNPWMHRDISVLQSYGFQLAISNTTIIETWAKKGEGRQGASLGKTLFHWGISSQGVCQQVYLLDLFLLPVGEQAWANSHAMEGNEEVALAGFFSPHQSL